MKTRAASEDQCLDFLDKTCGFTDMVVSAWHTALRGGRCRLGNREVIPIATIPIRPDRRPRPSAIHIAAGPIPGAVLDWRTCPIGQHQKPERLGLSAREDALVAVGVISADGGEVLARDWVWGCWGP